MRRAIVMAAALALAVPAFAGASRIATGSLRAAVVKAASKDMAATIPNSCLIVRVTTIGRGNWATVALHYQEAACNVGNGLVVVHRVRRKWRVVAEGSDMPMTECKKVGIPLAVQHDLAIPCH